MGLADGSVAVRLGAGAGAEAPHGKRADVGVGVGAGVEVEVEVGVGGCVSLACPDALYTGLDIAGRAAMGLRLGKVLGVASGGPRPRRDQVAASKARAVLDEYE